MIKANNIHHSYDTLKVLKGVDLHIEDGEFVSIFGASGAVKTTLLQVLSTLDIIQHGSVEINGRNITTLSENQLAKFRNKEIGFIFQFHNLLIEFTALENVCIPAFIYGTKVKDAQNKAIKLLSSLGLENRIHHKPNQLSGGEQQRVAVARALINSPSIIFADEPSGNLDSKNAAELHKLLIKLNKEYKQTLVIITHNNQLAKLANRELRIKDGKII